MASGWRARRAAVMVGAVLVAGACGGGDPADDGRTTGAATGATGRTTFPDAEGDVIRGAGPDLVSITVSHTRDDVRFSIRFAEAPPLRVSPSGRWVDMLLIGVDVPPTGPAPTPTGWTGVDYAMGLHGPQRTVVVRSMRASPSAPLDRFDATVDGAGVRFAIPRDVLGDPSSFEFDVAAARETEEPAGGDGADLAPATGTFRYVLGG